MKKTAHHLIRLFHDLFGEPINMEPFDDRLLLQKKVYFLQEFGIPFGYLFGWYFRGPYSSELAKDGFEIESTSKLFSEKWDKLSKFLPKFEDEDIEGIKKAQEFFSCVKKVEISEGRFLELLSSLHFLKDNWYSDEGYPKAAAKLRDLKPKFSKKEIAKGIELLEAFL